MSKTLSKITMYVMVAYLIAVIVFIATTEKQAQPDSKAAQFALRVDAAIDRMEAAGVEPAKAKDAALYVLEIQPFFGYEGLIDVEQDRYIDPQFIPQLDSMSHSHILGYTYCDGTLVLNGRFLNPVSTWYNRPEFLGTLVHEMVHNIGGEYCGLDTYRTESRTQLGMLEVLSALANTGNQQALYAVLVELRDIASDTYWAELLSQGKGDEFAAFDAQINDGDPAESARLAKAERRWANDMGTLRGILKRYSQVVFDDFQDFHYEVMNPWGFGEDSIKMDDLKYLLNHLEELTNG